jgi:signal transduction histidine kinase
MNTVPQPALPTYPRLRRFAIDVAITAVFNLAIALIVTYVIRLHGSFFDNFVISMCIGTLMVSFIDGGRLLLWGLDKPPRLPFLLLFIAALPSARYLGNHLAGALLGIPPENIAAVRAGNEISFFVMFLFTCLSIAWFFWNRGRVEVLKAEAEAAKARAAAIEKQAMQAQLQMLQAQIEPHMLFNTLANLQGLIAVDPPRAQHMLDQLIQYLRATLSTSRAERVSLASEFALMDAYLGLMQVRMGARLRYTLQLPDALRDTVVAPMLLQPLVENAIKHGLEPKIDGGEVLVRAEREANMLILSVTDTGLGLDTAPQAGDGIGTANVRERLHALYGARAAFDLLPNEPAGTVARLRIPL